MLIIRVYTLSVSENSRGNFAIQGIDYESLCHKGENLKGGRPTKDFALSIDFAKKISMMARTKRGGKKFCPPPILTNGTGRKNVRTYIRTITSNSNK